MEIITLQCWVYDDDVDSTFPVKISRTETVGVLKKVIKSENPTTFRDVDAKDLQLYSIFIPQDDGKSLEDKIRSSLKDKSRLNSRTKVSKLFPEPDKEDEWLVIVVGPNSGPRATEPPVTIVPDMTLNCWVCGDTTSSVFPVKILSTKTVAALKEVIKTKNPEAFCGVDPKDLALYKVSLAFGEGGSLEGVLDTRTISSLGKPLQNSQKLSTIFVPLPTDSQLHLIVDGLALSFQCWVRGADPTNSFAVQISMKARVDDLKNAIKAAYGEDLSDLSPDRLKLYKISVNEEAELHERLHTLASGRVLQGNELVQSVFDDVPFFQRPRVVVEPLDKSHGPAAIPSTVNPRLQYIQAWDHNPPKSPSQQGEASNFKTLQSTKRRIEWTRPPDGALTTPVTLLHPIFGQFIDDCHAHESTSEDNTFVLDLSLQMSKFFENESQRQEAFINILRSRSIGIVPSSFAGYHTDGDLHVNGRRYMILEVKSEVGSKGAEPYCQAILYYIGVSKDEATKNARFNFPCFIITLFGPHLGFSGAVWTSRPNYQVLSTVLPLFWHPTDTMMRQSAARHIGAFTKACRSLQELYEKFDQTPADFKDLQPEFPHPRCYTSLDGKNQKGFRYIRTLEASKLLFVVKTDAGEQLCIKFVQTYAQTVHQQCVACGVSPSLWGLNAVPGGWHMVVMDLLEGYECLHKAKHNLSREEKEGLREELRSKLTELHQMNFVHGDVRDANIMVRHLNDRLEWMLVDFDWSGKIGEV